MSWQPSPRLGGLRRQSKQPRYFYLNVLHLEGGALYESPRPGETSSCPSRRRSPTRRFIRSTSSDASLYLSYSHQERRFTSSRVRSSPARKTKPSKNFSYTQVASPEASRTLEFLHSGSPPLQKRTRTYTHTACIPRQPSPICDSARILTGCLAKRASPDSTHMPSRRHLLSVGLRPGWTGLRAHLPALSACAAASRLRMIYLPAQGHLEYKVVPRLDYSGASKYQEVTKHPLGCAGRSTGGTARPTSSSCSIAVGEAE